MQHEHTWMAKALARLLRATMMVLAVVSAHGAMANDYGAIASGTWSTSAIWTPAGGPPGSGDAAFIGAAPGDGPNGSAATATVSLGAAQSVYQLYLVRRECVRRHAQSGGLPAGRRPVNLSGAAGRGCRYACTQWRILYDGISGPLCGQCAGACRERLGDLFHRTLRRFAPDDGRRRQFLRREHRRRLHRQHAHAGVVPVHARHPRSGTEFHAKHGERRACGDDGRDRMERFAAGERDQSRPDYNAISRHRRRSRST